MPTQTEQQRLAALQAAGLDATQQAGVTAGTGYSPIITSDLMKPQSAIQVPPAPVPTVPNIAGGQATVDSFNKLFEQARAEQQKATEASATDPFQKQLQDLIGGIPKPPSASAQYANDYGASGIPTAQADFNTKQQASLDAQAKLAAVNARLAGLTAEATAIPIRTQQEAEGRGITAGGLAPITASELRMNALKAIPIQAEALVAQAEVAAAQGNSQLSQSILQQAQDHLDKVFQIHQTDSTNDYNYRTNLIDKVYEFASKKEQAQLDELKTQRANDFTLLRDSIASQKKLAETAIANGQGSLAAQIASLDPKSATFSADLASLQGQIVTKATAGQITPKAGVSSITTQVLDGFTDMSSLTPTNQQEVRNDLFEMGFGSDTPPSWFKKYIENERRASLIPSALQEEWIKYRDKILSKGGSSGSADGGGINFDDL